MNKFDKQCKTIRLVNVADIHSDCQNFVKQRSKINSISIDIGYQFINLLASQFWYIKDDNCYYWGVDLKSWFEKLLQQTIAK